MIFFGCWTETKCTLFLFVAVLLGGTANLFFRVFTISKCVLLAFHVTAQNQNTVEWSNRQHGECSHLHVCGFVLVVVLVGWDYFELIWLSPHGTCNPSLLPSKVDYFMDSKQYYYHNWRLFNQTLLIKCTVSVMSRSLPSAHVNANRRQMQINSRN